MGMKKIVALSVLLSGCSLISDLTNSSNHTVVQINRVDTQGVGSSIGTITFTDSAQGLAITPQLEGLSPGAHGFHIHENPDCSPKEKEGKLVSALSAGAHYDPHSTGLHMGPHGGGHVGDLPKLEVAVDGTASTEMYVAGLQVSDITNRSVMIHQGGDNYADAPAPLGGGGPRIACGVVK